MLSGILFLSFKTFYASKVFRTILSLKLGYGKLPKAAFVVHVADLSENRSLSPALVMDATNRPHTTYRRGNTAGRARRCVKTNSVNQYNTHE